MYHGQKFTVEDIAEAVECSRRTVRRVLNEQTELEYLDNRETKTCLANGFRTVDELGDGEIELSDPDDPFGAVEDKSAETRDFRTVRAVGEPATCPQEAEVPIVFFVVRFVFAMLVQATLRLATRRQL